MGSTVSVDVNEERLRFAERGREADRALDLSAWRVLVTQQAFIAACVDPNSRQTFLGALLIKYKWKPDPLAGIRLERRDACRGLDRDLAAARGLMGEVNEAGLTMTSLLPTIRKAEALRRECDAERPF